MFSKFERSSEFENSKIAKIEISKTESQKEKIIFYSNSGQIIKLRYQIGLNADRHPNNPQSTLMKCHFSWVRIRL